MQQRQSVAGFTMIETMLTVSIAALLITAAIPTATSILSNSYDRETRNEMREIGEAFALYYSGVGELPSDLDDLLSDSGDSGWDGPYVNPGLNPDGFTAKLVDEWGTEYSVLEGSSSAEVLEARSTMPQSHWPPSAAAAAAAAA